MMEAYTSGDPYLTFAKQCGAVPEDATKETHKRERDVFKTVTLGTNYGMEAYSLAGRLGISGLEARELLQKHRETYPRFWKWSQNVVDAALCRLDIKTVFGWHLCPLMIGPG
jgi:DNA polymerase I-like protein with 3'-5' exonuclease and polymerase domains